MKTCYNTWLGIICLAVNAVCSQAANPYAELARTLADAIPEGVLAVGVGNFVYEDTELTTPFSSLLRKEMERVLPLTQKFRVIARERLAELQNEGRFQEMSRETVTRGGKSSALATTNCLSRSLLEPGTLTRGSVHIAEVKGLVRGRFYYQLPEVKVFAELIWLDSGRVISATVSIPVTEILTRIEPEVPKRPPIPVAKILTPPSPPDPTNLVKEVESRVKTTPHDFGINLVVREARRDFMEGETISYRIWSEVDCHIAVFCHQADGTSTNLFPNELNTNTWVRAGQKIDLPGDGRDKFYIRIRPPFGVDVVQVVACTNPRGLQKLLEQVMGGTRGQRIEKAAPSPDVSQWSEAHVTVCTYPRLAK